MYSIIIFSNTIYIYIYIYIYIHIYIYSITNSTVCNTISTNILYGRRINGYISYIINIID